MVVFGFAPSQIVSRLGVAAPLPQWRTCAQLKPKPGRIWDGRRVVGGNGGVGMSRNTMPDTSTAAIQKLLKQIEEGPQSFSALIELVKALVDQNQLQQIEIDDLRRRLTMMGPT